jgi:anti-sigma regulatory factor (Ser/Thr protein kinase)
MPELSALCRPAVYRIELACDLAEVRRAAQGVHSFLAGQGCVEDDLRDCELAIVEACNNAIEYVQESHRQEPVVIEALCYPTELEFRVTDHTTGFDWPERPALAATASESGRGVYLIQSLMDAAAYHRSAEGNVLVLRRKRS